MTTFEAILPQPHTRAATALSMPGAIGLYFAFRVCLTFLFFQADPTTGTEVSVAINLLLLIPVALYAAGRSSFSFHEALAVRPFRLVIAFLGLALISIAWSETSSRSVALGYWAAMAADVALVLLLLRAQPASQVADSLLKGFILGASLLALVAWAAPALPDFRLGNDDFLNPNIIGFECAIGTLLCQYLAPQGTRWKALGILLVLTLVRSLSKTSILAFAIVEVVYLVRNRSMRRGAKVALTFAALFVVASFWNLFAAYYAYYLNNSTQAETLSGRLGIWLVTFSLALQEPWIGHGFHSFRAVIPAFGAFEPWHAHNELLQQFFTYGVLGIILLVALYWSFFQQVRRASANPLALLARSLLLLVLIRGLADTERFDLSFPFWAITTFSFALAPASTPEVLA